MKFTPGDEPSELDLYLFSMGMIITKCLNIILVPAALDVFDHETRLSNLRVSYHANFDHHAILIPLLGPLLLCSSLVLLLICV